VTDYRVFTVPLNLGTGTDMLNAMESKLGAYDPSRWRVFALNGANYIEISTGGFASLAITPGMGFWIITLYTDTIPFQGGLAPDGFDYEIELSPGWHMFALPWPNRDINLGNISVTNGTNTYSITSASNTLTQKSLWDYTGSGPYNGYEKRNSTTYSLQCGTGYFIKVLATSNVTLIIPPNNNSSSTALGKVSPDRKSTGRDNEEPPPGFLCRVDYSGRASSNGQILPLPPDGLLDLPQCPECSGAEGVLLLEEVTFVSGAPCQCTASESITIGNNVIIQSGANVTFQAPKVNLRRGFHAKAGAVVNIKQE